MIKKVGVLLLTIISFSVIAQEQDTALINQKKRELKAAQEQLKNAEENVNTLKSELDKLKPIVKWKKGGFGAVTFNQVGLTNWAAGGQNNISLNFTGNAYANYKFKKIQWDNNLDMAYGLVKNKDEDARKNEDKIDFTTKIGYKASKKFNYAALLNFKSQFAPGYDFDAPDTARPVISRFMSPAFLLVSVGMDYRPNDYLSVYLSPATGKFTFVLDTAIANQYQYIPESYATQYSATFRSEFGAMARILFQKDLIKNVNLLSKLELFNNFTDPIQKNRGNIDVNFENTLGMKISKYITANIFTHLIYDNDISVPVDKNGDGVINTNAEGTPTETGPRIQFKEVIGVGLSVQF